jgi:hypothetical protein
MMFRALIPVLVASWAFTASARSVPVEIYWSGIQPGGVFLSIPGGFQALKIDAGGRVFRGSIEIGGDRPQRKTITVRYGAYNHPFDIRVHRTLGRVAFSVNHTVQSSCTSTRVSDASNLSDNLADAVNRSVSAGELVSIPEPNACDENLHFSALRARYRQNAKMAELSNGFFLINRTVEEQYKEAARNRGLNVGRELAEYEARDDELEARQLVVFRAAAQAVGNYGLALETNQLIAARLSADARTAVLYQQQGLTDATVSSYAQQLGVEAAMQRDEQEPNRP